MDQQLAEILSTAFTRDLGERSVGALREARATCRAIEAQLSYLRRLVQGQHDIISGEIRRRAAGGEPDDVGDLVAQLPTILADRIRGAGPGRSPADPEVEDLSGALVDRLHALADAVPLERLATVGDGELQAATDRLATLEVDVSQHRRAVFERIDELESELLARYRDGEAQVDDLLGQAKPSAPPTAPAPPGSPSA